MPTAIAFQPDGKVLIAGWAYRGAPANIAVMVITRLLGSTLQLDPTFGFLGTGVVVIEDFASTYLRSIALTPDLEIVVAGEYGPLNAEDISVIGLRPNGTVHWGDYVAFNVGGSNGDGGTGFNRMVVQSDGKIVVAAVAITGNAGNVADVGVARTLPRVGRLRHLLRRHRNRQARHRHAAGGPRHRQRHPDLPDALRRQGGARRRRRSTTAATGTSPSAA